MSTVKLSKSLCITELEPLVDSEKDRAIAAEKIRRSTVNCELIKARATIRAELITKGIL